MRIVAAIGLLAAVVYLWIARAPALGVAAVTASLLVGFVISWGLSLPNLDNRVTVGVDTVLIDHSHFPAIGHYEPRVNPVSPLFANLFRSGFRVVDLNEWDIRAIEQARGIAFVAPQRSFTAKEIDQLLKAEEAGSVVLLTVGQPDAQGSRALLGAHDLSLSPLPMGTVTSAGPTASRREREEQPRFLDAWPIVTVGAGDPASLPGVEVGSASSVL